MPDRAAYLVAYLAELDVVVTKVSRRADGVYEVWAKGERVELDPPADGAQVGPWARAAAARVVARLGNRMLPA